MIMKSMKDCQLKKLQKFKYYNLKQNQFKNLLLQLNKRIKLKKR